MPKLTEKFISAFKPEEGKKDRLVFDTEMKGLGLRATAGGSKLFLVQWTDKATGRKARETIGAWGAITLEQAREAARIRLGRLAAGFDPKAEREARKSEDNTKRQAMARAKQEAAFTLEKLIEDWTNLHLTSRRPRYAAEATRALRLAFKPQLTAPAGELSHTTVNEALDHLVGAGKSATARLTMAYGRSCFGWAVKRRRLAINPFAGLPAITGSKSSRDRVLTDTEIGSIWRASSKLTSPYGPMVKFALLTLARREEVACMTWAELAADLSIWTQPSPHTKNHKPHVVHLSAPARAVLRSMLSASPTKALPPLPPAEQLVFGVGKNRPISGHSWVKRTLQALIDSEVAERVEATGTLAPSMLPWVLHDFRRSSVTWLAESGFPPHVVDRLLNHLTGTISGVAAVYQKAEFLDERQAALDAWGDHVVSCGQGRTVGQNQIVGQRKRSRQSL